MCRCVKCADVAKWTSSMSTVAVLPQAQTSFVDEECLKNQFIRLNLFTARLEREAWLTSTRKCRQYHFCLVAEEPDTNCKTRPTALCTWLLLYYIHLLQLLNRLNSLFASMKTLLEEPIQHCRGVNTKTTVCMKEPWQLLCHTLSTLGFPPKSSR